MCYRSGADPGIFCGGGWLTFPYPPHFQPSLSLPESSLPPLSPLPSPNFCSTPVPRSPFSCPPLMALRVSFSQRPNIRNYSYHTNNMTKQRKEMYACYYAMSKLCACSWGLTEDCDWCTMTDVGLQLVAADERGCVDAAVKKMLYCASFLREVRYVPFFIRRMTTIVRIGVEYWYWYVTSIQQKYET